MEDNKLRDEKEEKIRCTQRQISMHQVVEIGESTTNLKPRPLSFVLSFSNLTYNVKLRRKLALSPPRTGRENPAGTTKTILDDVSGEARDGEILALLGASGSGKSTLIDALANRIARGSLKGNVALNGETVDSRFSKAITAYVMQDDLLFPMLTVEETLMFAAEFRLPRAIGGPKKKERVQALIDQLGLSDVKKTIVGDEDHRGVSGGERRRVSIGVDIIHDPILLFVDEPTSGLDSTSAFMVVKVLKRIAQSGSVVVMSVHQPSYRILEFLDRLIFLSRGEVVFTGSPRNLPVFFSDFGHPIPNRANHVEFALDMIFELENSPDGISGLVEFNKTWRSRELGGDSQPLTFTEALSTSVNSRGKIVFDGNPSFRRKKVSDFANPFWIETLFLLKRSAINSRRMPVLFGSQLLTILITSCLLASIYSKLGDSGNGIRERLGFFAFAMTTPYYITCRNIPHLFEERHVIFKETAHNTYRRSSYVLAHCLYDLPSLFVLSLAFAASTFWVVGLDGGLSGFMFFLAAVFASFWAANAFVVLCSSVVRNVLVAFTTVMSISSYFLLFSGFFVTKGQIPPYWIWFHYVSTIKYTYEAMARSEFEGPPARCFAWGAEMFDNTPFADAPLAAKAASLRNLSAAFGSGVSVTTSTCLATGTDVLRDQSITDLSKWDCLVVVVAWGFLFWILYYFSLLLGNKNKRK